MSGARARPVGGRYRLLEPLGEGGMGRVWRAHDELLHRDVAVKEIVQLPGFDAAERDTIRERSLREARTIARLDHVNVVRIFDIVIADDDPWIVMEYIPSYSLQAVLNRDGRLPPRRAAEVGLAVLQALQAAHRAGVMHRDVKPANILLGDDGRIVLTDFGLATGADDPRLTHTGSFMGTPSYFAPERLQDGVVGPAADLWSLGITLFAAVDGHTPYHRGSVLATLGAVLTEPAPVVRHAGPLTPVIEGLLRKDPGERIDAWTAHALLREAVEAPEPDPAGARDEPLTPVGDPPGAPAAEDEPEPPAARLPAIPSPMPPMPLAPATAGSAGSPGTAVEVRRETAVDISGPEALALGARTSSGRHRLRRGRLGVRAGAALAILVVLLGAAWLRGTFGAAPAGCSGQVTLRVAAAPEIAPAVRSAARAWIAGRKGGACVEVAVAAADPADVAELVAGEGQVTVNGLGAPGGAVTRPDVWIPDSTAWLQRLHTAGAGLMPATGRSVARSPVVLAVPQPLAGQLGWPTTTLTWAQLLQKMTGGGLRAGIVDPARDAASLSALLTVAGVAATTGAPAQTAAVGAIRSLAANRSPARADLLAAFPRATGPSAPGPGLAAAPLPEHEVLNYNANAPAVPLVPLFLGPQPNALDYPFTVLPGVRPEVADLAGELADGLAGSAFAAALAQRGLRNADGTTGPGFVLTPGGPATLPAPVAADPALIERTLNTWGVITRPGRMLAVLDVSGSMKAAVPSAGGRSREQVTVEAAAAGLGLLGDDWSVGLWTFSTKLDGDVPYRRLQEIGPLATQRRALSAALGTVTPTSGDTGLFDTLLAAYRTVRDGWDPARNNSVVVLTDGQNDNPGGLTLDQLTAQLQQLADPQRRIQVIAIGIGEASRAELTAVTKVTGGGVFIAADPSQIGEIFLQAIALRTG